MALVPLPILSQDATESRKAALKVIVAEEQYLESTQGSQDGEALQTAPTRIKVWAATTVLTNRGA